MVNGEICRKGAIKEYIQLFHNGIELEITALGLASLSYLGIIYIIQIAQLLPCTDEAYS